MINESTSNPKLTTEQLLAINSFEEKMVALKGQEIAQTKNIASLTRTNVQLEKDRENLIKGIEDKKPILEQLIKQESDLRESILNAQKQLNAIQNEYKVISKEITQQQADLSDKQAGILADREQLTQDQTVLRLDKELFEKDKAEHQIKKSFLQ
jgi:predicted  nucleic acid-binding Zn-ribbon protein